MTTFNLIYLLQIIKKYRLYLMVTVGLPVILAVVFTMPYFYPPQFHSSTIVYPSNAERFDLINLFERQKDLFLYGTAKEVEKLGNFAKSETVSMSVIDSLNLWDVYGIDKKGSSPKFKALKEFGGNINISQTEGTGLKIEAYDTDPQRAAAIVNLIVFKINDMNKGLLEKSRLQILDIYEKDIEELQLSISKYRDSAANIRRKYNIYSYQEQTEVILGQALSSQSKYANAKAYAEEISKYYPKEDSAVIHAKARVKGAEMQLKTFSDPHSEVSLNKFQDGVDLLLSVEQKYFKIVEKLQWLEDRVVGLKAMKGVSFDSVLSVETAQPSDKKARPVRWIIIVTTLLVSSIVSVGCLVLIDLGLPEIMKKR